MITFLFFSESNSSLLCFTLTPTSTFLVSSRPLSLSLSLFLHSGRVSSESSALHSLNYLLLWIICVLLALVVVVLQMYRSEAPRWRINMWNLRLEIRNCPAITEKHRRNTHTKSKYKQNCMLLAFVARSPLEISFLIARVNYSHWTLLFLCIVISSLLPPPPPPPSQHYRKLYFDRMHPFSII